MYDLLIRNAQLLDGTGQPAYKGDIAIEQGRIAAIGDLSAATAKQSNCCKLMTVKYKNLTLQTIYSV